MRYLRSQRHVLQAILCPTMILHGLLFSPSAQAGEVEESLRNRIEDLRSGGNLQIEGVSIAATKFLMGFYEKRGFAPAWTDSRNLNALLGVLAHIGQEGLDPEDYLLSILRQYTTRGDGIRSLSPRQRADMDILLTESLIRLDYHLRFGKTNPEALDANWNFTQRLSDRDPIEVVEGILASASLDRFLRDEIPQLPFYERLKTALARYRAIAASGGWRAIPKDGTLRPGERDFRVPILRRRLAISGDLNEAQTDEPDLFDQHLREGVIRFQARHGLQTDGILGRDTIDALNVPVEERIGQIEVNMERARWLFHDIHLNDDFISVDIAAFRASLVKDRKRVWAAKVQVGRPYRKTPVFKASAQYLVFNPTWTVPPGILAKDILPRLAKDPGYLKEKKLSVIDRNGRRVDPQDIDWSTTSARNFPYQLRQAPGPDNALGRVKIMFPNPHLVYLHDTPSQDLFEKPERAFSSGCIRIQNALELAETLLDDRAKWNQETIQKVIQSNKTQTVTIPKQIPVLLLYWTAEVGEDGVVNFRKDIYGRDAKILVGLRSHFTFRSAGNTR
jgi:L,D-transpeptidase YcbB